MCTELQAGVHEGAQMGTQIHAGALKCTKAGHPEEKNCFKLAPRFSARNNKTLSFALRRPKFFGGMILC